MGQRLVLTIKDSRLSKEGIEDDDYRDSNNLMKLYYHWSGYTGSAQAIMMELAEVIKQVQDEGGDNDAVLKAVIKHVQTVDKEAQKFLSAQFPQQTFPCIGGPNGGKYGDEYKYIKSKYPDLKLVEQPDRSYGLINMTEDGMKDTQEWSEGDCIIDIGTGECTNWIVWSYENFEHWADSWCMLDNEEDKKEAKERYDNAVTVDCDGEELLNFNYRKLDAKKTAMIDKVLDQEGNIYKDASGRVYEMCK